MTPTPGPWAGRFENGHYVVVGKNRVVIRSCRLEDVSVIASAPEMMVALERILAEGLTEETRSVAEEVMRKARGEA